MGDRLGDVERCEEQLRNTLHSNDKDKLRKKLELLQREYLRTAQRLKRAEHVQSVRRSVRSHHDYTKAVVKPSSSEKLDESRKTLKESIHNQQLFSGHTTSVNSNTEKQIIEFSLQPDPTYTLDQSSSQDLSVVQRASPALRLRSRRSRLRWENSQEAPGKTNSAVEVQETHTATSNQSNKNPALGESEEINSLSENDSPSLLLPHWNLQGEAEKQEQTLERETYLVANSVERHSASFLLEAVTPTGKRKNSKLADVCGNEHKEGHDVEKDKTTKMAREKSPENADIKTETGPGNGGKRLLDSCTLVEGRLFPAEYYVRTTRRMAGLQNQPQMDAIILPQLSRGQQRRSRGCGRRPSRASNMEDGLERNKEPALEPSEKEVGSNSINTCEFPNEMSVSLDICSPSLAHTSGRGRRGRRGRRRRLTPGRTAHHFKHGKEKLILQDPQTEFFSSPKPYVFSEEAISKDAQPEGTNSETTDSTASKAQTCSPTPMEKIYPLFLKSDQRSTNCAQITVGTDWSLLLPSSSSALNGLLPLPSLMPSQLIKIPPSLHTQDFHLPDDQFAFLKLLKLCQVPCGVEPFTSSFPNTCSNYQYTTSSTPSAFSPSKLQDMSAFSNENAEGVTSQSLIENTGASDRNADRKQKNVSNLRESEVKMYVSEQFDHEKQEIVCTSLEIQNFENQTQTKILAKSTSACNIFPVAEEYGIKNQGLDSISQREYKENSPESCLAIHKAPSQLLLSASLGPASCPLTLPVLGFTPHPLTLSPRPLMSLPPSHSPTTEPAAVLSSCPESPPPVSMCNSCHDQHEAPGPHEPAPKLHSESTPGSTVQKDGKRTAEEHGKSTHTLKAPAGGRLVDVCCVRSSSACVCVVAAGKWAVCLWSRTDPSDWSVTHTWTFTEPVISVFPVPEAPDLFCVTLGQLQISEVRVLSCSILVQTILCDGVIQTVIGVSQCRVVSASQTTSTSILRVYKLTDRSSSPHSHPLVSPGGSIGSLASVEGLPDALLGADECGALFMWNLKTGYLLQKIPLGEALSPSTCLRGYSYSGVLFVLMQHNSLGSLDDLEIDGAEKVQRTKTEHQKPALFSLVAINPQSGRSSLATKLHAPKSWCGRLCEADVLGSSVVALSHRGAVCVWELEHPGDPRTVWAPDSNEGWTLARWGGHKLLLTAQHNGDVTLHGDDVTLTCSVSSV